MNQKKIAILLACMLLPLLIGFAVGISTAQDINTWYVYLNKPSFNPPNAIFGPVWTLLYLLMGVSLYLILQVPSSSTRTRAVFLFVAQLVCNFAWSIVFFRLKLLSLALLDILILIVLIVLMMVQFRKINAMAAYLQIPYLLWVSFAALLTYSIWQLN